MKKTFLLIFVSFMILCCKNKENGSSENTPLEEGTVKIKYKDIEQGDKVLEYSGIKLFNKFDISYNSDKMCYTHFIAFYSDDMNIKGLNDERITLIDYKLFDYGVFNTTKFLRTDTLFKKGNIECLIRVDTRANDILNNDSLYFAVTKGSFHTSPVNKGIGGWSPFNEESLHKHNEVIPYFKAQADFRGSKENVFDYILMGFMMVDEYSDVDFDKLFNSSNVKQLIYSFGTGYQYETDPSYKKMMPYVDSFLVAKVVDTLK